MDAVNRAAVQTLLRDADYYLALSEVDVTSGSAKTVIVANLRSGYADVSRRRAPLIMTDDEMNAFQHILDRLRARLRFFGETV